MRPHNLKRKFLVEYYENKDKIRLIINNKLLQIIKKTS